MKSKLAVFILGGVAAVIFLIVLTVGGGILFVLSARSAAIAASERFISDLESGNDDSLYNESFSDEFKAITSKEEYEGIRRQFRSIYGPVKSNATGTVNVRTADATMYADVAHSLSFRTGNAELRTTFQKYKGEWLLYSFVLTPLVGTQAVEK